MGTGSSTFGLHLRKEFGHGNRLRMEDDFRAIFPIIWTTRLGRFYGPGTHAVKIFGKVVPVPGIAGVLMKFKDPPTTLGRKDRLIRRWRCGRIRKSPTSRRRRRLIGRHTLVVYTTGPTRFKVLFTGTDDDNGPGVHRIKCTRFRTPGSRRDR